MSLQGSKEENYLNGRWSQQRNYYSKQAKWNKLWHQSLLLFSTAGAIVVPVLLNISDVKWVPTLLSVLVSMALALDNVYHFGDNWRAFRQTAEMLKQERVYFDAGVAPYADPQTAFSLFVVRCESLVKAEETTYFERNKSKERDADTRS